jgi:predicted DNA-binding protein YlxM (UPF0122 family)
LLPVSPSIPYGRTVVNNRAKRNETNAQWEIIPEDQKLVEKLFNLYVYEDYSLEKISQIYNISSSKITGIFNQLGGEWIREFKINRRKTKTIITAIPPLLTPQQIQLIKNKSRRNQTNNKERWRFYLLSSVIKCGVCGLTFKGNHHKNELQTYYVHSQKKISIEVPFKVCPKTINAKIIEPAVLFGISTMFSCIENLEVSLQKMEMNSSNSLEEDERKLSMFESQRKNIKNKINNLVKEL